eukprot:426109-Rhodomonas_salina.1
MKAPIITVSSAIRSTDRAYLPMLGDLRSALMQRLDLHRCSVSFCTDVASRSALWQASFCTSAASRSALTGPVLGAVR